MRNMKDSGIEWIGEIPENWKVLSLKRLFSARRGGAWGDDAANNDGDRICLRVADFNYDKLCIKEEDKTIRNYSLQTIKNLRLGLNDLLIEKSGGGEKTPVGRCVLPKGYEGCLYANFIDKLTVKTDCYNKHIAYLMCVAYYNGVNIPHIKQTTGIQNLDVERYLSEKVAVPPLAEQKKIADFLDGKCAEIDELVQTEEKMIEELKAYKQSVITEAVIKGLDSAAPMKDSGIEWIGEIPESWEVLSLKRLFSARRGGAWGEDATNNEGDIICLRVADFNYDELCIKEGDKTIRNYSPQTIKNLRLKSNDLLIEKSGGGEKTPVGRCILPTGYEGCLYANFIDRLTIKTNCYNKYIVYLMSVAYLNRINTPHIKQTTGIQNLDMEGYLSEDVAIPSLDEQKQIADYLDEKCAKIDEMIAIRNEQIDQLKEYKKSLIYEYVTGKKEVV